ncbi:hypothetical protein HZS_3264, partial [Henneguya salminicola]
MVYGHLDSVKFQLDQEGPLPSIIMGKLQQSKNHQESEIKYDSEHNVIYILTYQRSEDRSITDSTLYSSVLTDISFTPIELKYKYGNFVFTKIEVGTKIIVGFSEIRDVIAISINFGKDWEVLNLMFGGVNEIVINPDNSHFISILTKLNKVYIVKGLGEQISFHSNNGIKLIWSSNSEYLYYISESFENNKISLFITKYDDYLPSNLLSGVIDFGKIDNIIWAVTKQKVALLNDFIRYDLGHTWKFSTLEGNSLIPIKIFPDSSSSLLLTTIITLNENTKEWGFIKIDFTKTLKKECHANDYEAYTPGLHDQSACFQGQKGFTYRRKHPVRCKSLLDKLLKIPHHICPCTLDDFGCTFGNYFVNGQCIKDLDENENKIFDMCVPGEFLIMPSKAKILEGDICKSTEEWTAPESDICKFTSQDNSISVLIGSTIKYAYVNGNGKQEFINLPIDLNNVGNIKSYCVNFRLRCLYVLNGTGIIQFCYNKKEFAYKNLEEIFLQDYSILGMRLDQTSNDIFYYGLKNISIINEISKYSKVLYISYYDISYLNLFQTLGIIVYAYTNIDLVPNKYCVNFLSMKGAQKSNLCYDVPINAVAHDAENKIYVIYLEGAVFKVDYNYDLVEKKAAVNKHILEAYVNACKIDEILCDNDSKCVGYSDICDGIKNCDDGKDELNCHTAGCKYFEARCKNGQCVMKNQICDYNFDCADLSDEHGCDSIFDVTRNISCLIRCDNKCIPHDKVCNHITDCSDGADELDCSNLSLLNIENKAFCSSKNMLNCNSDIICYELFKKCDGFNDCLDGIDEANCEKTDLCSKSDIFECASMEKCISINDHCDGNKTNISFAEKIVTQRYILIKGLKNCNRYTAIVKIPGSNIWRSLQFTYKSAQAKSPKTIRYDYSRYLLHWSYYTEYCISSWFYIECLNRDRIVLQNFSTTNYIVVLYNSNLSCHVVNFINTI